MDLGGNHKAYGSAHGEETIEHVLQVDQAGINRGTVRVHLALMINDLVRLE